MHRVRRINLQPFAETAVRVPRGAMGLVQIDAFYVFKRCCPYRVERGIMDIILPCPLHALIVNILITAIRLAEHHPVPQVSPILLYLVTSKAANVLRTYHYIPPGVCLRHVL